VNRKGLMIGLDIARAAVVAVLPALALLGHLPIWWIYLVTFINSTLTVGFFSATNAAIPSLVSQDDLLKANGRIQASTPFATIGGPLLAGVLLTATSLQVVLWVDAATFLVSAMSLALIKTSFNAVDREVRVEKRSLRRDIVEGLRYVLAQPLVRNMAIFSLLANLSVAAASPWAAFQARCTRSRSRSSGACGFSPSNSGSWSRWRCPADGVSASRLRSRARTLRRAVEGSLSGHSKAASL
jgi:hypothetical protein